MPCTICGFQLPCNDSLGFVVELIKGSDGTRLALIDSFGVLRRIPSGSPSLNGSDPVVAAPTYVVPSSINGQSAFMRVRLYKRGDGAYYVARFGGTAFDHLSRLTDSTWQAYVSTYGGGLGKRSVQELQDGLASRDAMLQVKPNPATASSRITFQTQMPGPLSIVVYNALGEVVYAPLITSDWTSEGEIKFVPPSAGVYYVALIQEGGVIRTVKLNAVN